MKIRIIPPLSNKEHSIGNEVRKQVRQAGHEVIEGDQPEDTDFTIGMIHSQWTGIPSKKRIIVKNRNRGDKVLPDAHLFSLTLDNIKEPGQNLCEFLQSQ